MLEGWENPWRLTLVKSRGDPTDSQAKTKEMAQLASAKTDNLQTYELNDWLF